MDTNNSSDFNGTPKESVVPSELTGLYPRQLTYAELREKRARAAEVRRGMLPRYTLLTAGLTMAFVFAIVLNAYDIVHKVLDTFGAMSGVFFSFFFMLIVFGLTVWQFKRFQGFFNDRGMGSGWFFIFYITTMFAAAWAYFTFVDGRSFLLSIAFGLVHYSIATAFGSLYIVLKSDN